MTGISRFLLRVARWITGPERAEWIKAMEAEAASIRGDSKLWAIGCLWASVKDRLQREWRFVLAIVALPIAANLLSFALFYPTAWMFQHKWIPGWLFVGSALFSPLPFAFLLGRLRPGLPAYLALPVSFVICQMIPLVVFWLKFGKSPFSWFDQNSTFYMMTPIMGLTCAFLVWVVGVWLGSRSQKRAH